MTKKETLIEIIKGGGNCSSTPIKCPTECFYFDEETTDKYRCKLRFKAYQEVHDEAVADFLELYSKEDLVEELL